MIDDILVVLTVLAILGCGTMGGIFFGFSNFLMKALAQLKPPEGIRAMQVINATIPNRLFFVVFLGTTVVSIILLGSLFTESDDPRAFYLICGNLCYLFGVTLVSLVFNLPMVNALEAVEADTDEAAKLWKEYLIKWVNWNHVRTLASFVGSVCFILAIR